MSAAGEVMQILHHVPVVDFILHRTTGCARLSYWGGYTFLSQLIIIAPLFAFGVGLLCEGVRQGRRAREG
jgi:hypothetical protein